MATRQDIRRSVGFNIPGNKPGAMLLSTTTAAGSTTTLVDAKLLGDDGEYTGQWVVVGGEIRRVSGYDAGTHTMTVSGDLAQSPGNGATYELWTDEVDPSRINDFIGQAIDQANARTYQATTSQIWLPPLERRMDVPTDFDWMNRVFKLNGRETRDLFIPCGTGLKRTTGIRTPLCSGRCSWKVATRCPQWPLTGRLTTKWP